MDSNQVSLTRMMLNIATPSDQGISFSRGEILQGSVQEVRADGLVMMLLKGRLLEAATEVMVKPGQQLFLMVDDFRDGKTYLKVLNPERMEKLENANISANLQNMGMPIKEENVVFARKLLQHNLPVTPQNLSEVQKGVNILGATNPRNLEIVTLALSRGLPLSQQVLNALLQFTDPESDLSRLLKNLIQNLGQLSRQTEGEVSQPSGKMPTPIPSTIGQGTILETGTAGSSKTQPTEVYNQSSNSSPAASRPIVAENPQVQNSSLTNPERTITQSSQGITGREVQYPAEPRTTGTQTPVTGSALPPTTSESARDTGRVPVQVTIMQPDGDEAGTINRAVAERTGQQPGAERTSGAVAMPSGSEEKQAAAVNQPAAERSGQQPGAERTSGAVAMPSDGKDKQIATVNRPVTENLGQQIMSEQASRGLITSELLSSGGDKISSLLPGIKSDGDILKFLALIRPLLDVLQIDLNNNPAAIRDSLQNLLQSEEELVRALILIQDLIKNGQPGSKPPLISELLNRIEGMERELSGQRIFNYISRMPDSNFNYYYFSFPVKINDEYRLCQMRVNREAGNKLLKEQDNIKFIVSLDTANMGMVLFHVNWNKNKTLTLQGVVESNEVMHYFNKHISRLIEGLNQLGYTVNNLGVRRVQKDEEIAKLRPVMEEVPMKFRPFSIDVTV